MKMIRRIIHIEKERCDGCGRCEPACIEGALRIVDGKARLISDRFCDGSGACVEKCPLGALEITEREAEEFEDVVMGRC